MRPLSIFYFVSILFGVLVANLFKIQVIDHQYYREMSERNRIRPMLLQAARGEILDRYGRELVTNRLAFDCYIIPHEGKEHLENIFRVLSPILRLSPQELGARYKSRKRGLFTPLSLAENLTKEDGLLIEEMSDGLPGVFIKTRPMRHYPLKKCSAHVLGYVGLLTRDEYERLRLFDYRIADLIGKDGVEKKHDSYLRGTNGAVKYEVDSQGRLLRVLSIQEPQEGRNVQLTLDLDLQLFVSDLLGDRRGAVAVMELKYGGLLAFVSSPSYDPNLFVLSRQKRREIQALLEDPEKPLINRAISGEYPPGSTFKMTSAYCALDGGNVDSSTQFFCPGHYTLGKHRFSCWKRSGHGLLNMVQALEHSCNVFFYNVAMKLDINDLAQTARLFGFGRKTGVDLPSEKKGLVPTPDWKRDTQRKRWYKGETLNVVIGQGAFLVTPIQLLRSTAIIATGGILFEPHLLMKIDEMDVESKRSRRVIEDNEYLTLIRKGMFEVVQSDTGTGQRARSKLVTVSGKTGTAQAHKGEDHAWFTGYAPSDDSRAAIVVFLEHGGKGGGVAAPIAAKTFSWMAENGYFR